MATTIHNLDVRFDVEGEGDEAVFTKYFDKHIRVWDKAKTEMKARQRFTDAERSLGEPGKEVAD